MTKKELSQLYYLKKEIRLLEERAGELRAKAEKCTAPITGRLRGGLPVDYKAQLVDLAALLENKITECNKEQIRLENYINSVSDSLIRQILIYRYIENLTWRKISFKIGGGNTEEGIQMLITRFLSKN